MEHDRAGRDRGVEERLYRGPIGCLERDVDLPVRLSGVERSEPERRPTVDAVPEHFAEVHHPNAAQRREHRVVERGARADVGALDRHMIEHGSGS